MALEKRANKGGGGGSQHVFKTPGRVEIFDRPIIIIILIFVSDLLYF